MHGYTTIQLIIQHCHVCMTANFKGKFLKSTQKDQAFIERGFHNWKDATEAFRKHEASSCHQEAILAIVKYPNQIGDVG